MGTAGDEGKIILAGEIQTLSTVAASPQDAITTE